MASMLKSCRCVGCRRQQRLDEWHVFGYSSPQILLENSMYSLSLCYSPSVFGHIFLVARDTTAQRAWRLEFFAKPANGGWCDLFQRKCRQIIGIAEPVVSVVHYDHNGAEPGSVQLYKWQISGEQFNWLLDHVRSLSESNNMTYGYFPVTDSIQNCCSFAFQLIDRAGLRIPDIFSLYMFACVPRLAYLLSTAIEPAQSEESVSQISFSP